MSETIILDPQQSDVYRWNRDWLKRRSRPRHARGSGDDRQCESCDGTGRVRCACPKHQLIHLEELLSEGGPFIGWRRIKALCPWCDQLYELRIRRNVNNTKRDGRMTKVKLGIANVELVDVDGVYVDTIIRS